MATLDASFYELSVIFACNSRTRKRKNASTRESEVQVEKSLKSINLETKEGQLKAYCTFVLGVNIPKVSVP